MKEFFEKFAADNNFDPHNAEEWYTVPMNSLHELPVCFIRDFRILKHFRVRVESSNVMVEWLKLY